MHEIEILILEIHTDFMVSTMLPYVYSRDDHVVHFVWDIGNHADVEKVGLGDRGPWSYKWKVRDGLPTS